MAYPSYDEQMSALTTADVAKSHPVALIENTLRAAIGDLSVVAEIVSDMESLIEERERSAREDGEESGYDRGCEEMRWINESSD